MNKRTLLFFLICSFILSCRVQSGEFNDAPVSFTPSDTEVSPEISTTPLDVMESPTQVQADVSPTPKETVDNFQCPPGWFLIESVSAQVGASSEVLSELDPKGYPVNRVPLYQATVESFCISPFPYPAGEGNQWPEGLNLAQVGELDLQLEPFGLRLATGSEYLVAVSTDLNQRWPQGKDSWEASICDPDPYNPSIMGSFPVCSSSWGPGALLTFGLWVRADQSIKESLLKTTTGVWQTVENYIVLGGMPSDWYAYYGDDLWGAHQHGEEDPYWDDKPGFLVSSPWEMTQTQWENFQGFIFKSSISKPPARKNHRRKR